MSKIFFTSDTHFCHDRGFIYEPRDVKSVDEMNEKIIKNWNAVVGPDDVVYHLGDAMLNDNEKGIQCFKRLNGTIKYIKGNHDTLARIAALSKLPNVEVLPGYSDVITVNGFNILISHHPTYTSNLDNDAPLKRHLLNFYGHTHQFTNFYQNIPFMYHVGLDSHNCTPVSFEDAINDIADEVEKCYNQL